MNFAQWLLKRMHRKLFGGEWGWLFKYREFIQEEMNEENLKKELKELLENNWQLLDQNKGWIKKYELKDALEAMASQQAKRRLKRKKA